MILRSENGSLDAQYRADRPCPGLSSLVDYIALLKLLRNGHGYDVSYP